MRFRLKSLIESKFITRDGVQVPVHADTDVALAQKLASALKSKIKQPAEVIEADRVFNDDPLPKPVKVRLGGEYRSSSHVDFVVLFGKIYFSGTVSTITGKGDATGFAKAVKSSSWRWSRTGQVGKSLIDATTVKKINGKNYWVGIPVNMTTAIAVAKFVFDAQSRAWGAEADYYRKRGPKSGIGHMD